MIYRLGEYELETESEDFWVAPTAVIIGRVKLGREASIWWNCVLRGDGEPIEIGARTNIQDGTICHTDPGYPLVVGDDVTVGHAAVLHGCTIGSGSLVGIGAMVLTGAKVGRNCLIAAKALVAEGKEIPDNSLVMGIPGKIVGEVRPDQLERMARGTRAYVANWKRYRRDLVRVD
ncbi:MAG: gamma carbonic anhydrase family protein [Geminicoccaceae bacterium]|nr:gamma carbonic anhydrase family protein [Geminicoccaceae bacterium]